MKLAAEKKKNSPEADKKKDKSLIKLNIRPLTSAWGTSL